MLQLRDANLQDLVILQYWDTLPHVLESDSDDWNWEYELPRKHSWREQLMAEVNGKPIGFIQIIDPQLEESHYWGEIDSGYRALDIWIGEPDYMGKGYGTEMMKQAIARCFSDSSVHTILVDPLASNVKAHRFYESLGFTLLEERRFYDEDCKVYQLVR